jgi:hypothetical protein
MGGICVSIVVVIVGGLFPPAVAQGGSPQIVHFGPRQQVVGRQQTYTLFVEARGDNLEYRWWHREPDSPVGHPIPYGEGFPPDEPTLTVPDAQTNRDYDGWYWCVITDVETGRSVRSPKGKVKVVGTPMIAQHPKDRLVRRGGSALFAVRVLPQRRVSKSYQWFFNDQPIDGANRRILVVRGVQEENAGFYYCRVETIGGVSFSDACLLQLK